jgi:hypothetical protein
LSGPPVLVAALAVEAAGEVVAVDAPVALGVATFVAANLEASITPLMRIMHSSKIAPLLLRHLVVPPALPLRLAPDSAVVRPLSSSKLEADLPDLRAALLVVDNQRLSSLVTTIPGDWPSKPLHLFLLLRHLVLAKYTFLEFL